MLRFYTLIKNIGSKILFDIHDKGWKYTAGFYLFIMVSLLKYPYYINKKDSFLFNTEPLNYFYHWYNITYANERCIEIPIIMDYIQRKSPKRVLEVGNVLGHYLKIPSDVVDKYEDSVGIINMDIMRYARQTDKKYDMILCISTIEHIGFEEEEKDPQKIKRAIIKMKCLLTPNGTLLITLPIGWNQHMDKMIFNREILSEFTCYYFKRLSKDNRWQQVQSLNEMNGLRWGYPFPYANGIIIAEFKK